jgi:hypothetical protein
MGNHALIQLIFSEHPLCAQHGGRLSWSLPPDLLGAEWKGQACGETQNAVNTLVVGNLREGRELEGHEVSQGRDYVQDERW